MELLACLHLFDSTECALKTITLGVNGAAACWLPVCPGILTWYWYLNNQLQPKSGGSWLRGVQTTQERQPWHAMVETAFLYK